jgi:hypothetical protein
MKSFIKVFFLCAVVVASSFAFTGCKKESPVADPSALLQQSIYNLFEVSSLRYAATLGLDTPVAATGGDVSADVNVSGAFNHTDKKKSNFDMTVVADAQDEKGEQYKFDFSMKSVNEKVYIQLLEAPTIPGLAADGFKDFVGPWWQIDTTQLGGMGESLNSLDTLGAAESELSETDKKTRQLILTSEFFSNIEYEETKDVGGSPAYVFSVNLNKDGLLKFFKGLAEINGQTPTQQEENDLMGGLSMFDFDGNISVDVAASVLVGVDGKIIVTDPTTSESGDINVELSVSDLNKPFEIKEPTDFKVFDLGAFFGAFLGAGMSGGMDAATGE